ncbi:lamin tail domain-containing protein [Nonomuraea sp. NPDC059023]|uniref:lamin tail domain-containing protein n=1 Tax=unclassified Nonomuraea TaxID=2593643 RepID=UPI0036C654B4
MRPTTLILACAAALVTTAAPAQAAVPKIQLVKVYYDSPGVDRRSNSSLNGEYAVVRNTTRAALDLEGWTIADQTGYWYTFGPGRVLKAGKSLTPAHRPGHVGDQHGLLGAARVRVEQRQGQRLRP